MQLDEMSQYAEMEDLLIYIFLEIPVEIIKQIYKSFMIVIIA